MKAHLFTDADNTLWDTDKVFAAAQLDMLRQMERLTGHDAPQDDDRGLTFLRELDQRIAETHPDHLRYPPALLARGLSMVLQGQNVDEALALIAGPAVRPDEAFESAQARFLESIASLPPLRSGVREGLSALSKAGVPITIVTEERPERCRRFVSGHHLEHLIGEIASVRKTSAAYHDLKRAAGSARCFMVGDQIDRDIVSAESAGFATFYFPGGFAPYWNANLDVGNAKTIDRYDAIVPDILSETRRLSA